MMRRLAVFGATSAIARAAALNFARDGDRLFLVGRDPVKLQQVAAELRAAGAASVTAREADLDLCADHDALVAEADTVLGGLEVALIAQGLRGDPARLDRDYVAAGQVLHTNLSGAVSLAIAVANRMRERRAGTLAVISSIAGDRGRNSSIIYGAAKGGLTVFLEGLRCRLHAEGVHVLTIKPGYVDTPMFVHSPLTKKIRQTALFARPDRVGRDIYRAIIRRRDVLYTPWFWSPIMFIVRHIPAPIYKRIPW